MVGGVDGDVHFSILKEKQLSLEITVHAKDELVLKKVQNLYAEKIQTVLCIKNRLILLKSGEIIYLFLFWGGNAISGAPGCQ